MGKQGTKASAESMGGYTFDGATSINLSPSAYGYSTVGSETNIDPRAWLTSATTYWHTTGGTTYSRSGSCTLQAPDPSGKSYHCGWSATFVGMDCSRYNNTVEAATTHGYQWEGGAAGVSSNDAESCGPGGPGGGTNSEWHCWSEEGFIEISYDGGQTWQRIWEGYITYCELIGGGGQQ